MNNLPDKETMCHRTGFEKSCRDMVCNSGCRLWTQVQGAHPQTGETISHYNCADAWLPVMLVENSQMSRQTGAAVESLRNEMRRDAEKTRAVLSLEDVPLRPSLMKEVN